MRTTPEDLKRLIDMDEEAACALLVNVDVLPVRVVKRDGVPLTVTADYRPNRVNLEITDGKVSRAYRDGCR